MSVHAALECVWSLGFYSSVSGVSSSCVCACVCVCGVCVCVRERERQAPGCPLKVEHRRAVS